MNVLAVDIGGTNVKILASGQAEPRKFPSGSKMTLQCMVAAVKEAAEWKYDVVSIGYPGRVLRERVISEPHNGSGLTSTRGRQFHGRRDLSYSARCLAQESPTPF